MNLYITRVILKYEPMRNLALAFASALACVISSWAAPAASLYAHAAIEPGVSEEILYSALPFVSGSASIGAGLGPFAMEIGAMYQGPSAYSDEWYRYRGFVALFAALGPRIRYDRVTAFADIGLALARYDASYSYFILPYFEPGALIAASRLDERSALYLRASVPLRFGADSWTAGLRLGVEFDYGIAARGGESK